MKRASRHGYMHDLSMRVVCMMKDEHYDEG